MIPGTILNSTEKSPEGTVQPKVIPNPRPEVAPKILSSDEAAVLLKSGTQGK